MATPLDELIAEILAVLEDEILGKAPAQASDLPADQASTRTSGGASDTPSDESASAPSGAAGARSGETRRALIEAAVRALRRRLDET